MLLEAQGLLSTRKLRHTCHSYAQISRPQLGHWCSSLASTSTPMEPFSIGLTAKTARIRSYSLVTLSSHACVFLISDEICFIHQCYRRMRSEESHHFLHRLLQRCFEGFTRILSQFSKLNVEHYSERSVRLVKLWIRHGLFDKLEEGLVIHPSRSVMSGALHFFFPLVRYGRKNSPFTENMPSPFRDLNAVVNFDRSLLDALRYQLPRPRLMVSPLRVAFGHYEDPFREIYISQKGKEYDNNPDSHWWHQGGISKASMADFSVMVGVVRNDMAVDAKAERCAELAQKSSIVTESVRSGEFVLLSSLRGSSTSDWNDHRLACIRTLGNP